MRKPTRSVLDSFALLAFLFREHGFEQVEALFDWAVECGELHRVSAVNWAEVRYIVERKMGTLKWPLGNSAFLRVLRVEKRDLTRRTLRHAEGLFALAGVSWYRGE